MQFRRNQTGAILVVMSMLAAMPVLAGDVIDDPTQIDERATQLIQASNSLCWEMHRFHQQQPHYRESYRAAKELWSEAGQLQEAIRSGPVETELLLRHIAVMDDLLTLFEATLSKWKSGDRSLITVGGEPVQRTVVTPGVAVDIPFIGLRVGGGQEVVVADGVPPQMGRKRFHPNSRGSKRSLERELAAVEVALKYLSEDAGMPAQDSSDTTGALPETGPVPKAPTPAPENGESQKVTPASKKKSDAAAVRKN